TGAPFFVGDLSLSVLDVLLVALGIPIAAAIAARLALRRVIISPLGVTRRVTPAAPSAWRLLPLLAGLAELGYFVAAGRPSTTGGQAIAFTTGVIVTMAGLVFAGPWLTMVCARGLAGRARRPAALLAARRLADDPRAGFRAVSGLVLGLFVATVAIGIITSFTKTNGGAVSYTAAQRSTLTESVVDFTGDTPATPVHALPAGLRARLLAVPGVTAIMIAHAGPGYGTPTVGPSATVSCTDLARFPAFGRCAPGATTAVIDDFAGDARSTPSGPLPGGGVDPAALARLPITSVSVATDGTRAAIERARTVLGTELPAPRRSGPITLAEGIALSGNVQRSQGYQRLADAVVLASLPIAGATLAVSVVSGLNERKRPFSLLRLAGAPLRTLRRVVTLETAVPLLAAAGGAIGVGFLTAYLFLRAQLSEPLTAPSAGYWGVVAVGILASLAIVASTLPVLTRITGPETARTD
ncbi:MAG: ABC transporter permease, partial [Jatrophihabitans sp.]